MTVRGQVWLDVPTVGGVSGIVLWFEGEYKRSPGAVGGLVHRTHDGIYTWRRGKKKKKKEKRDILINKHIMACEGPVL